MALRRYRRYRRRTVRVSVEYTAEGGVSRATATTLGAGGLFVETDAPLAPGLAVEVRFRLASGNAYAIVGRVAWAHPPGMGIEFRDPAACARLARELEASD